MSFDFALQKICSHEVFFESVPLNGDQLTLSFQRPPSSSSIQVYVDDTLIPRSGLLNSQNLPFQKAEPYRIKKNVSDLMYIKIGNEVPKFIPMISGQRLNAKDIVSDLRSKIPELNVSVVNNRVTISPKSKGIGTLFSFPDPRWTDVTESLPTTPRTLGFFNSVGIVPGRAVVGRVAFPGWDVVKDPTHVLEASVIKFNEPIRNADAVFQINYVTDAPNCRRCQGIRIEFDYNIQDGTYEEVRNADLLSQELDKFLFTKLGSHWRWNWLGSRLLERIGAKSNSFGASVNAIITSDISSAFATYQNIKQQQDAQLFQSVTDAEFPYALNDINVKIDPVDPTTAVVFVDISTRSQTPIQLTRIVGNPNPFTLQNDPQKNLRIGSSPDFLLRG